MRPYQICERCVMDTSDPGITFNAEGVCHHCVRYDWAAKKAVFSGEEGRRRLERIVARIKRAGKNRSYDCVAGVSGGVDSTYVVLAAKRSGLRILAVHLDNGWDSELAVKNIHLALEKLGVDLYTHVIDWEEFRNLQLSFLKASTPDSEIPTDHAIFALMYQVAWKQRIPFVLTGLNQRTESHLPAAWSQGHVDWKYIRSVHERFGTAKLSTFPHASLWDYYRYYTTITTAEILNYMDYRKSEAMAEMERELGWKYYGGKHYESIYTRFYQGYILPKKFGYDKRRSHFSSLICEGEMTREQALVELGNATYPLELQAEDREYVIKKLGLTEGSFEEIMSAPHKSYRDFPSYGNRLGGPLFQSYRVFRKLNLALHGRYR